MKRTIKISGLLVFVLLLLSCKQGKETVSPEELGLSGDTLELAAESMQSYIDDGQFAGIAVRTIKNGIVVQDKLFGYADIENQVPIKNNTIYRIFSMSKPVTTVALMTLYDEGKFKLDDKVSDYIPEFAETMVYTPNEDGFTLEPQQNKMTIRNLLTHTSGLTYGWEPGSYVDSLYNVTGVINWDAPIGEKVKQLATLPLKYQPGTRWEYGLSIDVAGYLVEILSGKPLDQYFDETLFEPLKMDDTGFYVPEEKHERLASLYSRDTTGKLIVMSGSAGVTDSEQADFNEMFKSPTIHFSGGGGLVSTVDDYTRFCMLLLNGGELDGVRILEESTVDLIMSDQLPEGVSYGEGSGFGLGGSVVLETGEYGWGGAASTSFSVFPEDNMATLAFTQFMPSTYTYANEYKETVRRAIIK
jgi:CubicO group peptidase (beta-lactamase class C family)